MTIIAPKGGQVISSSRFLGPVADAINRLQDPMSEGDNPSQQAASATASAVESAILVQEHLDTLTITLDASGNTVTAAKPPSLRGSVGSRVVDGETDEIFPAYTAGAVLQVASVVNTGVSGVTYADLNWDARRWTHEVDS